MYYKIEVYYNGIDHYISKDKKDWELVNNKNVAFPFDLIKQAYKCNLDKHEYKVFIAEQ